MRKEIKPPVAIAIIALVIVIGGYFLYKHSFQPPKAEKPAELLAKPGVAQELAKQYEAKYGKK